MEKLNSRPELLYRLNKIKDKIALFSSKKRNGSIEQFLYLSLLVPLVFAPPLIQGLLIKWVIVSKAKSFIVIVLLQIVANGIIFGSLLLGYSFYETLDPTFFL